MLLLPFAALLLQEAGLIIIPPTFQLSAVLSVFYALAVTGYFLLLRAYRSLMRERLARHKAVQQERWQIGREAVVLTLFQDDAGEFLMVSERHFSDEQSARRRYGFEVTYCEEEWEEALEMPPEERTDGATH